MTTQELDCDHTCPRDCALLNEALCREEALGIFYDWVLAQCDYPDVRSFVEDLAKEQRASIRRLEAKINQLYSSYNPAGC